MVRYGFEKEVPPVVWRQGTRTDVREETEVGPPGSDRRLPRVSLVGRGVNKVPQGLFGVSSSGGRGSGDCLKSPDRTRTCTKTVHPVSDGDHRVSSRLASCTLERTSNPTDDKVPGTDRGDTDRPVIRRGHPSDVAKGGKTWGGGGTVSCFSGDGSSASGGGSRVVGDPP